MTSTTGTPRAPRLRRLDEGLWTAEQPLRFGGLEVGARMTVVRLAGGGLLLHSPIRLDDGLRREVEALGHVVAVVAPNRLHHLFAGDWASACDGARLFAAPGLDTKRPDLRIDGVLGDHADPLWSGDLDQALLHGLPMTNEVVFFHRPSATLVATDLAFHVGPSSAPLTRTVFRLSGAYERLAPTPLEKLLVRDRAAFTASMRRVFAWPFDRVIVAHGTVLENGGRRALADGYAWLAKDLEATPIATGG